MGKISDKVNGMSVGQQFLLAAGMVGLAATVMYGAGKAEESNLAVQAESDTATQFVPTPTPQSTSDGARVEPEPEPDPEPRGTDDDDMVDVAAYGAARVTYDDMIARGEGPAICAAVHTYGMETVRAAIVAGFGGVETSQEQQAIGHLVDMVREGCNASQ